MSKGWFVRLAQAAAIAITIAAVCQELEKPKKEREWHGKVGFIPYDFRPPTMERLKESYWNPDSSQVFTREVLGIGWAINFYALMEKLRLIGESYASEDDFLMPTQSLKKVLENRPAAV